MSMSVPGNSCKASTSYLNNTGCIVKLPGECVSYTGASISGPGINTGDLLNTVVSKLATYIAQGDGTVSSVALSMPAAFNVTGSPVTSAGTLAVTAAGTSAQYILGNGTLATFPVFSNGLTPGSGTVKLGGSLTEPTIISSAVATNTISFTGTSTSTESQFFLISNGSTGMALQVLNGTTGIGATITSAAGIGLVVSGLRDGISSTTGDNSNTYGAIRASESFGATAVMGTSVVGRSFLFAKNTNSGSAGNDVATLGVMRREAGALTGVGNGLGMSIDFEIETSTAATPVANQIRSRWTTVLHASRTSEFTITGVSNAVTNTLLTLSGNGATAMNQYGDGLFTAGTATYALGVDANGTLMELPIGAGGTVTSFSFTDGNGFDGTVIDSTTTPALSLTTTVADTQVIYSNSGALAGHVGFIHQLTGGFNNLTLGTGTANQGGILNFSYGTDAGGALVSKFNGTSMMQFGFNNSAQFAGSSGANSGRTFYIYDEVAVSYRGGMGSNGTLYIGPSNASYGLAVQQPTSGTSMTVLANGNVGIGNSSPLAPLDIIDTRISAPASQVHIGTAVTGGIYLTGLSGDGYITNSEFNGSSWVARSTSASILAYLSNGLMIFQDGGLTAGSAYSPTARVTILNNGSIGIGTTTPDTAAILQLDSTTRGFLPPRMDTTQRDAISAIAGLMIYNTSTNKLNFYNGSGWEVITSS